MTTILVTGCAGFIGSSLSERLLSLGNSVMGVDSLTDYYPVRLKIENLKILQTFEKFKFINRDIHDINFLEILGDVEYIYHLAAQPGVRQSWGSHFDLYVKNNILATQKLLEASIKFKIRKFVYASSSSIYGNQHSEKLSEDLIPRPLSPYGVTKLAAENLCALYHKNYSLPVISLRLFTVFGPKQRPDMAFQKIIDSVKNKSEFQIYGNGEQKRDFTYIENVVNAFILAIDKGTNGEVYNIGGGETISLKNVIRIFEELLNMKIKIKYSSIVKGDVKNTSADIEKAKTSLGYNNVISLPDAIKKQLVFNSL